MQKKADIPYKQELLRKSIHLTSLLIPVLYIPMSKSLALKILIPITLVALLGDVIRHFLSPVQTIVKKYFGAMMRQHELDENRFILNGATYVLLAACVSVIIFPKIIAITAFSILIISDLSAALIGRKFGKRPFFDKSLEGTATFVITAISIVLVIGINAGAPWTFFLAGAMGGVAGGIIEAAAIKLRLDDNFAIPLTVGSLMWAMDFLFKNVHHISFVNLLQ
ncbi:MAG TPA: dolichol kinase [Patescibacteria group bacterium]|nr:dolichol kinase [Patescibacteria group bacterium]